MLHLFYTNLQKSLDKRKFLDEIMQKCRVGYPTARSWVSKPTAVTHRNPKPVYWPILSEITGIPENKLFKHLM